MIVVSSCPTVNDVIKMSTYRYDTRYVVLRAGVAATAAAATTHYDSIVIHQRHWPPTTPKYDLMSRSATVTMHPSETPSSGDY